MLSGVKMCISYGSNIWTFYHNTSFLSVSYLHCFLFVCFHFRPLNKKSKVRCLKLFLLFSLKSSCLCVLLFTFRMGEKCVEETGVGTDDFRWSHTGVFHWVFYGVYHYIEKVLPWGCLLGRPHFLMPSAVSLEHMPFFWSSILTSYSQVRDGWNFCLPRFLLSFIGIVVTPVPVLRLKNTFLTLRSLSQVTNVPWDEDLTPLKSWVRGPPASCPRLPNNDSCTVQRLNLAPAPHWGFSCVRKMLSAFH